MSEWIPVSERLPEPEWRVLGWDGAREVVVYICSGKTWRSDDGRSEHFISHWMPLPNPPPRESSRDRWWKSLATVNTAGEVRFVEEYGKVHGIVGKAVAFAIWDIAIAASKRDDFVP